MLTALRQLVWLQMPLRAQNFRVAQYQAFSRFKKTATIQSTGTDCPRWCSTSSSSVPDLATFPLERIRNFSIIAHIDHGKSTLADRILEHVGAISKDNKNEQILDKLPVERERGITVKAQTAAIVYEKDGQKYLLNLMDTPGHVDFCSEVSRSLASCQGVILLVDANAGVQAQTMSNFFLAFTQDLFIIPVLNKIDLPNADPESVKEQLFNLFEIDPADVLLASAKLGSGIREILDAVVDRIPHPQNHGQNKALRILLQDCWYDKYKGAVNLVQVIDGKLTLNEYITSVKTGNTYQVKSLGILTPYETPVTAIYPGQVGYLTCNMKSTKEAIIGDTFHKKNEPTEPVIEVTIPKPMVYAGFYPLEPKELPKMKSALEKVAMNDSSVDVAVESSMALGQGWRMGFLGVLHMEVFSQRLEQEYDAHVVITTPSVPYKVRPKPHLVNKYGSEELTVLNLGQIIPRQDIEKVLEPMVTVEFLDQTRMKMEYVFPLSEIITTFFDDLKGKTSGYASFDYEDYGFQEAPLAKMDILVNGVVINELATMVYIPVARTRGKALVAKLKENLPRQQYSIAIQAAIGSNIIARENMKALRKDVTAKLYGGDLTRKRKLLKHQAEGKKRLKSLGNIQVSKEVFVEMIKK